ncbi:MAG: aminopeptidase P family protein [Acholeplasmatales bacterium]|nr:aminopeptidase P family protein [Acholeplasmatales bacterium]
MLMDKIKKLQQILTLNQIDAYIIPTADEHNSEYISAYYKIREYLTGFTGSAGTLIITQNKAFLWTDGRYHIQATKQLEGKPITLMKQGLPNVPSIEEFLIEHLKKGNTLAFNGKTMDASFLLNLKEKLPNINIKADADFIHEIWEERPELPFSFLFKLEEFYAGKSFKEKVFELRAELLTAKADAHILSTLEDQAWLYNLRADDIPHTPVFLAFTFITDNECHLFIQSKKIDKIIEKYLKENEIILHEYTEFYQYISQVNDKHILLDFKKINYAIYLAVAEKNQLICKQNPTLLLKAIKNKCEIENIKHAHVKDGVAFTKLMYHVKSSIQDSTMNELSVTSLLQKFREQQESFIDISFDTICAYKEHGAMMHYKATEDSNVSLEPNDFLLIDSGGHYLDGTTDITRTLALGALTDTQKLHFTTVLKSVIALSEAVFLKGVKGINLDILARGPIWKLLLDYKCGTGHGVGYLLSVHEAPNGFRWQVVPERNDSAELVPGMITTNEPGIYLENKYGIRIENEMLCVAKGKSDFGDFLGFETITIAPIDLDAIDIALLTKEEIRWLNQYHQRVYDTLSPYLDEEERSWLKHYTREI